MTGSKQPWNGREALANEAKAAAFGLNPQMCLPLNHG